MNVMRAISSEGYGRIKFYRKVRENLINDRSFRAYFEGETDELPDFYINIIKKDLGPWFQWLPEGAIRHNPNAYLDKQSNTRVVEKTVA
jgi:hypothetical protein